ncbi:MAG: ABC transporter permease subunit [Verrucomicrobiota bacterium]
MKSYFIRRFLLLIPTLLGITIIVFLMTRFVPGGPIERALAESAMMDMQGGSSGGSGDNAALSDDQIQQLKEFYGLDKPWYQAYAIWLGNIFRGDLGTSYRYQEPVLGLILSKMPISVYYGLFTVIITYLVCLPLGIAKALKHRGKFDNISSIIVFGAYAIPGYALGALLVVFLAARWEWFPMGGFTSDEFEDLSLFGKVKDLLHHSFLPLICYLIHQFAFLTMMMKNHLMDNLAADYIRTAVAKGVRFRKAVVGHAMRNSLIPIATNVGQNVTIFVTGSFLIETIFDIDGFGLLGFTSILDRDYPVVMGVLLVTAFLMLLGNIISDMCVALVDPRVRFK